MLEIAVFFFFFPFPMFKPELNNKIPEEPEFFK